MWDFVMESEPYEKRSGPHSVCLSLPQEVPVAVAAGKDPPELGN